MSVCCKGRVERKHRVFQDRFVKELKLYGISTLCEANNHLEAKFLNQINEMFAVKPCEMQDAHRVVQAHEDLNEIFSWNYTRQIKNDWTVQFKREYYQIKEPKIQSPKPGEFMTIRIYLDGQMRFWHQEKALNYQKLERKPEPPSRFKKYYESKGYDSQLRSKIATANKHRSPWSKFNPNEFSSSKSKQTTPAE